MLHMMKALTVGLEIEITGGARDAVSRGYDMGLTGADSLHSYHCSCRTCTPDMDRDNILAAQEDCTVDGEFITRPIFMGDADSWALLDRASAMFARVGAYADPSENTGCHVHVGAALLDELPTVETDDGEEWDGREQLAQWFIPLQEDLTNYARGLDDGVRDYNYPLDKCTRYRRREDWLNLRRRTPTVEFRVWNGTTAAWRWRMYAGISAAMVLATLEGRTPMPDGTLVRDALDGLLDDETLLLMALQEQTPR